MLLGRLIEKRDKFGNRIQIKRNGNTTEITDTIGRKTIITNDSSKTEIVLPDNNKITYTNENGKLTKTDANGLKTIYEYEQYGSLTDSNIQMLIKKTALLKTIMNIM